MAYQWAAGFNNAAGLAALSITAHGVTWQPRLTGLKVGLRRQLGDGNIIDDGFLSGELLFGFLNLAQYGAFLTQTGLDSAVSVESTMALPNNVDRTFTNYNCILVRPDIPDNGIWYGTNSNPRAKLVQVAFPLTHVEEIA